MGLSSAALARAVACAACSGSVDRSCGVAAMPGRKACPLVKSPEASGTERPRAAA